MIQNIEEGQQLTAIFQRDAAAQTFPYGRVEALRPQKLFMQCKTEIRIRRAVGFSDQLAKRKVAIRMDCGGGQAWPTWPREFLIAACQGFTSFKPWPWQVRLLVYNKQETRYSEACFQLAWRLADRVTKS